MIELFQKYVEWKILSHFLEHPTEEFYVKELARILEVSPGSVSTTLRQFKDWGLVKREKKGQTHMYKLNNDLIVVKELKKAFMLIRLHELELIKKLLEIDGNVISIVIYGSFATGDYDKESDVDLLIIASKKHDLIEFMEEIEAELNREVSIEIFSIAQWKKIKAKMDPFYTNVMHDHILLYGSELI
jgi:predicted nucleotidyltransferase